MTRNSNRKTCRSLAGARALALAVVIATGLGFSAALPAFAAGSDDLPGTYELPLRAAAARSASTKATVPADASAPASTPAAPSPSSEASGQDAGTAKGTGSSVGTEKATGAADTGKSTKSDRAAKSSDTVAKGTLRDATPATFTITGKKFLEGRTLQAGEFSFRITVAGAALVPLRSDLPKQLREGSSLSASEKYDLVTGSGLVYRPSATQPVPEAATVGNTADGTVSFGPLTFDETALGETATQRHSGVVFCYTISEDPPRNADGTLKDGVTRDKRGRYVYDGVTYDDSVKRVYLYAYETGDDAGNTRIVIVPLGDATFDGVPVKSASGEGRGFVNIFNGVVLDSYLGAVYLEGEPIAAGEFNFDVREVGEDGKQLDDQTVSCEGSKGGSDVAPVQLIDDEVYGEPGRFFYAIHQVESARSVASRVELDETSYVVTVEVTEGKTGQLEAAVTYVRQKPASSDQWVDVDLNAKPSPVVWHNTAKDAGSSGGTDNPDAGDKPGTGDGTGTGSDDGTGAATTPDAGASGDAGGAGTATGAGDASKPDSAAGEATDGAAGDAPDAEVGKPSDHRTEDTAAESADNAADKNDKADKTGKTDKADKGTEASGTTIVAEENGAADAAKASGAFAQTGDDLGVPMLIAFLIVVVSGVVLAIASRRRTPRS